MPSKFHLIFADWRSRPGRTEQWREQRRANFPTEDLFKREYPETLDDVLLAAEELVFGQWAIQQCLDDYEFPVPPITGFPMHRYLTAWDQGRKRDATVGITLDITAAPYQIVAYERLVSQPYGSIQERIEARHKQYTGRGSLNHTTYVGDDNTSLAIVENLNIPATHFLMSSLKPRVVQALKIALEQGYLRIPRSAHQLIWELGGYMWDDDALVQDSVMALAIALYHAGPPIHNWSAPTVAGSESRTSGAPRRTQDMSSSRIAELASTRSASKRGQRTRATRKGGRSDDAYYLNGRNR